MSDQLITLCRNNENYFRGDSLQRSFLTLVEFLEKSGPVLKEIDSFASDYDFDEKTPGNGFRSFIHVFDSAVIYTEKICSDVKEKREKFFFRKLVFEKWDYGEHIMKWRLYYFVPQGSRGVLSDDRKLISNRAELDRNASDGWQWNSFREAMPS